ncbi:aspartic peptidase domain-containing protein [Podospora conica]|nr:aspartic peptidase domain-containing protein [Schizothecium conicum]
MLLPSFLQTLACGFLAISPTLAGRSRHEEVIDAAPFGISFTAPEAIHPKIPTSRLFHSTATTQRIHGSHSSRTNLKSVAAVLGAHQRQVGGFGYENITSTSAFGTQYSIEVDWDNHTMSLLLDTGSSDTWAVHNDFECIDYMGFVVPQVACGFGPKGPGDFRYGPVSPAQHLFIRYGDGELATGPMGYADITIGNITVNKQQVALANTTYWFGNNKTSGLLGLAFPGLTQAYLGTGFEHSEASQVQYSPLFTSMVSQGKVPPVFSIAIDRNASTGTFALGGIPQVSGLDPSTTATTKMLITSLTGLADAATDYSFYTIVPDGWEYDQTTDTKAFPFIVDSGTTLCYLPSPLAYAINNAFDPPAAYLWSYGAYFTSCDAVAPPVALLLNGKKFWFNPRDLIYRDLKDPETGLCMTAISNGGSGPFILGDAFMQNALVVFDVGQAEVQFVARPYY